MKEKTVILKDLFENKKYSEIIFIIENKINEEKKNSGILNLLGVSKLLNSQNKENLLSAVNNFRQAYLKEKGTPNSMHGLKNFINASMDIFDIDFKEGKEKFDNEVFEEILIYFSENKIFFEKNHSFLRAMMRVFKRNLDLKNAIYCLKKIIDIDQNNIDAMCSYIYFNGFIKDWDQKKYLDNAKHLNKLLPIYPIDKLVKLEKYNNKKINLAFLSADVREKHSVTYFLETVLKEYNNSEFDIYLYINNKEDSTTEKFKKLCKKTLNIKNLNDVEAINAIRNDKIDILIDLMAITSDQRLALLKNRLAPIQISWCGYCNTSGLDQMDYLIADKNLINKNEVELYSEKIILLPKIWNCHIGFNRERKKNLSPAINNKYITFGSFNNFRKISDDVIMAWSEILKKVPNSKLILKASDSASIIILSNKFKKNNVLNQIYFQPHKKNFEDHLNEYNKIDISLDTFPYNGVTTSFEAIWMGVPVVTLKGFNFNSRCGESINKNMNLEHLIGQNKHDYINKTISLAADLNKLEEVRNIIFNNALKSPLFNTKEFSNDFFNSLKKIYN